MEREDTVGREEERADQTDKKPIKRGASERRSTYASVQICTCREEKDKPGLFHTQNHTYA